MGFKSNISEQIKYSDIDNLSFTGINILSYCWHSEDQTYKLQNYRPI